MNRLIKNYIVAVAVAATLVTFNFADAFAQRGSRGGGFSGGGRSSGFSGGRGGGGFSRPSGSFSRPSTSFGRPSSSFVRPSRVGSSAGIAATRGGRVTNNFYGGSTSIRTYNGIRTGFGFRGFYHPGLGYGWGHHPFIYRPFYGYYNFYRPYIGLSIGALPFGYYPFWFSSNHYYYSSGYYYLQDENDDQYKVVEPPVGATVPKLPDDANQVTINGTSYYEYKGVYYLEKKDNNGNTVYEIAGKDGVLNTPDGNVQTPSNQIGDIVNQLPEGTRSVNIKGEKYYVSPDDVYYEEINENGTTSYKVVGQP